MFSDLRGFTAMSEKMPPQDIIGILNRYLERMTRAIQDNGGAIDKFMGDGIMALFGAPQPLDNPTRYAFDAAKQMLDELDALNAELVAEGRPMLRIGIGLHEGYVIVGNIGSERRNEYTAIGDTVNTCSRIEGLTRDTDYPLLISKQARQSLPDDVPFAALGEMVVKGRNPVEVYGWPVREEAPAPAALPGDAGAPPELIR
jgi:adenylate cyclase